MMDTDQTRNIVKLFLNFLGERNLEKLSELFSENIDWYIPGDIERAGWLGRSKNRQEVKDFYNLLWENTSPLSATVDHILCEGNTAIVTGEFTTKMLRTGKTVTSLFCIQITVENNLIVRYRLLEDSFAVSVSIREG